MQSLTLRWDAEKDHARDADEGEEKRAMAKRAVLRGGLLVSAVGVIYSGLMFLNLVPATLSIRFWDGARQQ